MKTCMMLALTLLAGCQESGMTVEQYKMYSGFIKLSESQMERIDRLSERIRYLERNTNTAEIQQLQIQVADLMEKSKRP